MADHCCFIRTRLPSFVIQRKKLGQLVFENLWMLGLSHMQISVTFLSPRSMQKYNREFRKNNYSTDVLAFPQKNFKQQPKVTLKPKIAYPKSVINPMTLGDVLICPEIARKNAALIGHGLDRECAFLLVHGILHLCGFDHMKKNDEKVMLRAQRKIMRYFDEVKPSLLKNLVVVRSIL